MSGDLVRTVESLRCGSKGKRGYGVFRKSVYDQLLDSDGSDDELKESGMKRRLGELSSRLWSCGDGDDEDDRIHRPTNSCIKASCAAAGVPPQESASSLRAGPGSRNHGLQLGKHVEGLACTGKLQTVR